MQSFALGIEASIAIPMACIGETTSLSSFLSIFDGKSDILARLSYKVFTSKMPSIITNWHLEFTGLSIISNIYLNKIGWQSESWSNFYIILQWMRFFVSSNIAKIKSIIFSTIDFLYFAVFIRPIYAISLFCITSNSFFDFFI